MKKITKTFLRTEENMNKYIQITEERRLSNPDFDPFADKENIVVKEFNYWRIIENDFPYDIIASVSHILITKRKVSFDWGLLIEDELDELEHIKKTYLSEHYDLIWENLPRGKTVPEHFHLNLLVLKREE